VAKQRTSEAGGTKSTAAGGEEELVMDAKYNWLIDNAGVRITLNMVALALWIAMSVGLLELAVKL
jgi:hypothetical protein